jgi:dolichol-phosphate mannosyltransferase
MFLLLPYFDHMHRFLPALVIRAGGQVRSVPVNHRPRARGRSHYGIHNRLWVGLVDLMGVMWLGRRARRTEVQEVSGRGVAQPDARRRLDS